MPSSSRGVCVAPRDERRHTESRSPGGSMAGNCSDSQYFDRLLRVCTSCQESCSGDNHYHDSCAEFCASLRCQAKPGHVYDALLKACLPCVELCGTRGRHPAECAHVCEAPPTSGGLTQAALQSSTTRGSSLTKGEHHAAAIYCLLGLCLAALFCTLAVTLLVLLRKAKGQADQWGHRAGPKDQENSDDSLRPSSKDRLLDAVVGGQKRAWPTETCMHCFPQQQRGDDRPAFYQQANGHGAPCRSLRDTTPPPTPGRRRRGDQLPRLLACPRGEGRRPEDHLLAPGERPLVAHTQPQLHLRPQLATG
ncbi:hypothetical protein COCON_G00020330 [Conger conger]|uniref:TNFR-Cys domain-containing protein n=1 Tax=Conger conger TaxID=82655 RepID=A0A9Q1I681_CONCO|nr:hypothetical protein COCON_G00020330 [Conger conger]